jgi:hypothetical protein
VVHRRQWTSIISLRLGRGEMAGGPQGSVQDAMQSWFGLRANVLGFPASCPEPAARRAVDRARHIAFEDDPPPHCPESRVGHWSGREQSLCIGMARVTADGSLIAELDDAPEVHDRDPV